MQFDLFTDTPRYPALLLQAHDASGYRARTRENALGADLTVAMAQDFQTGGEVLTHRMAGERYVGVPLGDSVPSMAEAILKRMTHFNAFTLNIAGNGIYTLSKHGWSQDSVNRKVFEVLARVHAARPLSRIRSGGQTGVDTAGLVAGLALGVPVLGLYPKNFVQRFADGTDHCRTASALEAELRAYARDLATSGCNSAT